MRTEDDADRNKQRQQSVDTDLQRHSRRSDHTGSGENRTVSPETENEPGCSHTTTSGQTLRGTVRAVRQKKINQMYTSWKGKYQPALTSVENSAESKIFRMK